jgi:NAD-dependent dihydropyrimidine dehydrogenase PreA subunit
MMNENNTTIVKDWDKFINCNSCDKLFSQGEKALKVNADDCVVYLCESCVISAAVEFSGGDDE